MSLPFGYFHMNLNHLFISVTEYDSPNTNDHKNEDNQRWDETSECETPSCCILIEPSFNSFYSFVVFKLFEVVVK